MPNLRKSLNRSTEVGKCFIAFVIALVCTVVLQYNNDYMRYRDIPVTFIEKGVESNCHKSNCRTTYIGLFKTDGEIFFDRPVSYYMYTQTPLRKQFELNLRPMDIRQTPRENVLYFILPAVMFSGTSVLGIVTLLTFINRRSKSK